MNRVLLRREAQEDLQDGARWYEEQRTGLGEEFLDQVLLTFNRITETPLAFPEVHRGLRRALIRRFPFAVYFRLDGVDVSVFAILHGSRSPDAWKART